MHKWENGGRIGFEFEGIISKAVDCCLGEGCLPIGFTFFSFFFFRF